MGKFDLTVADIESNINRFLAYVYASATTSKNPHIFFIVAGPGAGKSGVEAFLKYELKGKGEKASIVNSDKIAEFHPYYEEALEELLPGERYTVTRQFVRPATPIIFDELRKHKINILNENIFNKGESDIEFVRKFKDAGYRTSINILATDIFINRLSCYEREVRALENGDFPRGISKQDHLKMYNAFVEEVKILEANNLCDEINVYVRGESINKPKLVYEIGSTKYRHFLDALNSERAKQRKQIFSNPTEYLRRIEKAKESIRVNGINPLITRNSMEGLEELQNDFNMELEKEKIL